MPARYRFSVALTVEQFLAACHLGAAAILDLEPCSAMGLGRAWPIGVLGHDTLQVQLARVQIAPCHVHAHGQRTAT